MGEPHVNCADDAKETSVNIVICCNRISSQYITHKKASKRPYKNLKTQTVNPVFTAPTKTRLSLHNSKKKKIERAKRSKKRREICVRNGEKKRE